MTDKLSAESTAAPTTARQKVYAFLGLPDHMQIERARKAEVWQESDTDLSFSDRGAQWAKRAKEKGTLDTLLLGAAPSAVTPPTDDPHKAILPEYAEPKLKVEIEGEAGAPDWAEKAAVDICRELYDRFVMGGWEPQDAHSQITALLRSYIPAVTAPEDRCGNCDHLTDLHGDEGCSVRIQFRDGKTMVDCPCEWNKQQATTIPPTRPGGEKAPISAEELVKKYPCEGDLSQLAERFIEMRKELWRTIKILTRKETIPISAREFASGGWAPVLTGGVTLDIVYDFAEAFAARALEAEPRQPNHLTAAMSDKLDQLKEVTAERDRLQQELAAAKKLAEDWQREFNMYRSAWLREMGGIIIRKTHEIDGFVLRTREIYEKSRRAERAEAALADMKARQQELESSEYDQKSVSIIKNLSMLVRRLAYKHHNIKLANQAIGYLQGEGLQGSILREADPPVVDSGAQSTTEGK